MLAGVSVAIAKELGGVFCNDARTACACWDVLVAAICVLDASRLFELRCRRSRVWLRSTHAFEARAAEPTMLGNLHFIANP